MLNEPTIHQLEELLAAFRNQGGTDAEISALAQDIIRDFRPETTRPVSEIFGDEQHPTIKAIPTSRRIQKILPRKLGIKLGIIGM